jgi:glycosyltransferase involved in cell wall biosynthesis
MRIIPAGDTIGDASPAAASIRRLALAFPFPCRWTRPSPVVHLPPAIRRMSSVIFINGRFLTQRVTGVQRHALEVTRRLIRLAPDRVRILTPRLAPSAIPEPLRDHVACVGRLTGHLWEQTVLPRAARSRHSVLWSPANAGPIRHARHVVTLHDVFAIDYPQWVSRRYHWLNRLLLPRLSRRAHGILTVSAYSRDRIASVLGVAPTKIRVVYNGVDDAMRPADASRIRDARERYGLPADYLLALGSLEPRKNLHAVVAAWDQLPSGNRPALVIVGAPGAERVFGKAIALDGAMSRAGLLHLGYVDDADLPALYSGCAAFVHAAFAEGFGLPPLEALCCGAPVIASNTAALPEVLNGHARFVDPHRPEAIAEAMTAALASPTPQAQRHAVAETVRRQWTWDRVAERVHDALAAAM